jgi:peptidoglycan/LPS O-acetylase OafA/YrhL
MNRRRRPARRTRPTPAAVLYALGLLALLAVAFSLRGAETAPLRWAMIAFPVSLMAAAGGVVRRAPTSSGPALRRSGDRAPESRVLENEPLPVDG